MPPASREQIHISRQLLQTRGCLTDIQRAALFLHLNKTSFGGGGTSVAVVRTPTSSPWIGTDAVVTRIRNFQERFQSVLIESVDYQRLLKTYDHPQNFIFLDPPYGVSDVKNYDGWDEEQLTAFRDRVATLESRWIVTLDDSPINRALWAGFDVEFLRTRNGTGNQAVGPTRFYGELIIYSPGLRSPCSRRAALRQISKLSA